MIYIAPNGKLYQDISHGKWSCSMFIFGIYPIETGLNMPNNIGNMDFLTEQ